MGALARFRVIVAASMVASACGAPRASRPLGPNDVSVLFPMAPAEALWPATMPARGGPLLPRAELERVGLSIVREVEDELEHDAMRVVAARFDPCFRSALDGPCQPQIRLVFQVPDPAGGFFDGAVHALYALEAAAWDEVVTELRRLAGLAPENGDATLGVSPVLAAQGPGSLYAQGLRELVAAHAGEGNLVRLTFVTRTFSRSGQWQMGGVVVGGDKLPIAGIDATQQNVTRSIADRFEYVVMPLFAEREGRVGASATALERMEPEARREVHAWAVRQQDPTRHLPDTTDCASCHVSAHVARHLEALDPTLVSPTLAAARGPRARGRAEAEPDNLRAFGWFGREPVIAQRTANETAAVLSAIDPRRP